MRIIHCAWAAALLSALAAGSCAKDTTGNGGTGTTESYNDKIDSYLAERYLWNGEYGQMTRDLTIEYAADNDNFLTRTLLGMTSNTLDKKRYTSGAGTELLQPLLLHHPQSPEPRGHGAENARRQSRRPQGDGIRVRIRPAGGGPVLQHGEGRILRDGGISRLPGRQGGIQTGYDLLGDRRRRDRRFGERIHPRIQAADKPFGSRVGPLQSPGDG